LSVNLSRTAQEKAGRPAPANTADQLRLAEEEIRSLCGEVLERYEETTLIYRLLERLGEAPGETAIAATVLKDAARVLGACSGEIWLQGEDGVFLGASVPSAPSLAIQNRPGPLRSLQEGRPWVQESSHKIETAIAVPIPSSSGTPAGVIVLTGRACGREYRAGELKLLTALATMTASFLRIDRLAAETRTMEARAREREIARQVYLGLLPDADPSFPGTDISGACLSADTVGGDYYGYHEMPDGSLGIVMADVTGHGIGAAMYMAAMKGVFKAESRRVLSPADLLRRSNEALESDFSRAHVFATAFFVRVAPGGRRLEYALAGHNPPIVVRKNGDTELLKRGGLALGLMPQVEYQETSLRMEPGDVLVAYTDGLVEARDAEKRFFSLDRLRQLAVSTRELSAERIRSVLLDELSLHTGGNPPADDVTLVVLKVTEGLHSKGSSSA
jgi:serine phosphatase RsbU (regulator of sigma subunit)